MSETQTNKQVVLDFMESWETHDSLREGYETYIADDCLWENTGMRSVTGKENVTALVGRTADTWGEYYMRTEKRAVVAEADTVIVERVDVMLTPDGEVFLKVPITGVFEVRDGKITRWSDYYDPKPMFDSAKAAAAAKAEKAAAQ